MIGRSRTTGSTLYMESLYNLRAVLLENCQGTPPAGFQEAFWGPWLAVRHVRGLSGPVVFGKSSITQGACLDQNYG